jgi:N-acetylneuraminic acid mutarotase
VHGDQLIVAGGANFPDKKPWEGGTKVWYDDILVLDEPSGRWRKAGKLPRPLAYGVSFSTPEGLICVGGSDDQGHHESVFRISLTTDGVSFTAFPDLPKPCANLSGALLGRTLYVVGGIDRPDAVEAMNSVWSLDLDAVDRGWQPNEVCPGPGRMLAAVGAQEGSLFVFSGAALKAGPDGKPVREWLQDGYRFTPGQGWQQVKGPPQISIAAPNPMPVSGDGHLLLLGGDDGAQVDSAPADHQGFPKSILAYDVKADTWTAAGTLPVGLVTTSAVLWRDLLVIPGGEIRPGTRSTQVWAAPFPSSQESSTSGQKNGVP